MTPEFYRYEADLQKITESDIEMHCGLDDSNARQRATSNMSLLSKVSSLLGSSTHSIAFSNNRLSGIDSTRVQLIGDVNMQSLSDTEFSATSRNAEERDLLV
jgi:hypothetical protein